MNVNRVFIWNDSTTILQWFSSTSKHTIFVSNRVCENTQELTNRTTLVLVVDAGTRGIYAEVLQSSSCVRVPEFIRDKPISLEASAEAAKNIKLGVAINENDEVELHWRDP